MNRSTRFYLRVMLLSGVSVFVLTSCFLLGAFWYLAHTKCIDFSALAYYRPGRPSIVLDLHGHEWTRFQLDKRDPIQLSCMPRHLIDAFIATEDWSFFKHHGLSYKGILRSVLYNLYYGKKVQGASTITQQLVRLLFFNAQKTFSRKIKEQFYALLVERQFTKEQILEAYLNHVYFGCGIYGVEAASQRFWGKSATYLTIDEAATLAGIVRSPGNYCPLLYPRSAQKRRNVVLNSMHKLGYISQTNLHESAAIDVRMIDNEQSVCAPHLRETLRQFLEEVVGKEALYCGGLVIQSTLDLSVQTCAQQAFSEQITRLRNDLSLEVDGALMTIDVTTGEIRALIGGFDFKKSKFNRAFQAKRQMGSVFKPIVYAAGLLAGKSFTDTYIDEPSAFTTAQGSAWHPQNYNNRFNGQLTLARALITSNNIVTIKMLLEIGLQRVITLAHACKLKATIPPYPSLALGCVDETLKEVAGMFNLFAHHGVYVEPHPVRWIKNELGEKIWRYTDKAEKVLDACIADQIAHVLMACLDRTRSQVWGGKPWMDCQGFSKTGTTNDSRTCWFAGSTPDVTTVIYIGCDDNRSLGAHVFPSRTAFPIWAALHTQLKYAQKQFAFDSKLQEVSIHTRTGEILAPGSDEGAMVVLL